MATRALNRYFEAGLKVLRERGLRTLFRPTHLFREVRVVYSVQRQMKYAEMLDYSADDLKKNEELMMNFSRMGSIDIESINWFIPYFTHVYAGMHTILRFAEFFHRKNIRNTFFICSDEAVDIAGIRRTIAQLFPNLQHEKVVLLNGNGSSALPYADVNIATFWSTAYTVLRSNNTKGKFYMIQDYEPLFYKASSEYALAEATYRFGFYGLCNTPGIYDECVKKFNGIGEYFVPSIDGNVFYCGSNPRNEGAKRPFTVFFYARPHSPRNAFEIGIKALQRIKRKYGNAVTILTAGEDWDPKNYGVEKEVVNLGVLPYEETGPLYRRCDLGIVFMLTKHPSYIPFELMACGCPVISNYNQATAWLFKDGENSVLTELTISSICEKIEMLMSDESKRQRIALQANRMLVRSNWEGELEKIYDFMRHPSRYKKTQ